MDCLKFYREKLFDWLRENQSWFNVKKEVAVDRKNILPLVSWCMRVKTLDISGSAKYVLSVLLHVRISGRIFFDFIQVSLHLFHILCCQNVMFTEGIGSVLTLLQQVLKDKSLTPPAIQL